MLKYFVLLVSALLLPLAAQAQVEPIDCGPLKLLCPGNGLQGALDLVRAVVNISLTLVAIAAVIVIIYAGIRYIFAGGEEKKAEEAKNTIVYVVIGLMVIGLSAAIVNFIIGLFSAP